MDARDDASLAARSMVSALKKIPLLRLEGENGVVMLCYRRSGETIEDDECDLVFEAGDSGIYRRFSVFSGEDQSYRWMHYCRLDEELVRKLLMKGDFGVDAEALGAVAADCAFQAMRHEDGAARVRRGL